MPAEPNQPTNRVAFAGDPPGDMNAVWLILNGIYRLSVAAAKTANYTAVQSDSSSFIPVNSSSNLVMTIPQLLAGTVMQFGRKGTGTLTFTAGSGVTFTPTGTLTARATGSVVTVFWETATSVWVFGDLT